MMISARDLIMGKFPPTTPIFDPDLPTAIGTIDGETLNYTCPSCGNEVPANINLSVLSFEKKKNMDTRRKKLCSCGTWTVVEIKEKKEND